LGEANRVLAQGHWERPFLRKIIFEVAQAMQVEDRILLKGPDAELRATATFAYTLAFYELCTNALKHGSCEARSDRLKSSGPFSAIDQSAFMSFGAKSVERPLHLPARQGFGSRLISTLDRLN
jgi:two-component sensor histidine kinase